MKMIFNFSNFLTSYCVQVNLLYSHQYVMYINKIFTEVSCVI